MFSSLLLLLQCFGHYALCSTRVAFRELQTEPFILCTRENGSHQPLQNEQLLERRECKESAHMLIYGCILISFI